MSLYDDIDTDKKSENVAGWASGIKFLQTHMQLKKSSNQKRDGGRKPAAKGQLGPVVDFKIKSGKDDEEGGGGSSSSSQYILPSFSISRSGDKKGRGGKGSSFLSVDADWQFENEYDPMFPNEYDKALKDLRERRDREAEEEEAKRRAEIGVEEEEDEMGNSDGHDTRDKGVSIAPPPSLNIDYEDEISFDSNKGPSNHFSLGNNNSKPSGGFGSMGGAGAFAAAKIMAKYGYKEGQGLGKQEQGMATALQVEKTSHRIGRIIHEKDLPKEGVVSLLGTPPNLAASYMDDEEFEMDSQQFQENSQNSQQTTNPTSMNVSDEAEAAEQLRNPSKVVLLTNMVGPGEVDDDLEPEVKEECLKYGEVITVIVFQMPDVDSEDSIRIFVEFAQVGSAVKAFMDLNGRFFGGRQVKASFYDPEKFNNLELTL